VFGSDILEVAIGIVFVFLIVSVICSAVREGLEAMLKTRAAYLEAGIRELLGDRGATGLAGQLYSHPLISGLYSSDYSTPPTRSDFAWLFARGRNLPSYIPSRNFALAVMDLAARGPVSLTDENREQVPIDIDSLRRNAGNLQSPVVRRVMLTALDSAQGDLDSVRLTLQAWYDSSMDRISGWYKRSTQWIIFAIGLSVAVGANIDTIEITKFLYTNKAARSAIVADAQVAAADTGFRHGDYQKARAAITDESALPIGLEHIKTPQDVLHHIVGWLVTALAASMGAPFWFDLLNKMMVIRSTVKPHEKSPEESSEDRQSGSGGGDDPNESGSKDFHQAPAQAQAPVFAHAASAPIYAAPPAAVAPTAPMVYASSTGLPHPHDNDEDACDVDITSATADEDLPPARGGVALS
jgi:hypothetical protein